MYTNNISTAKFTYRADSAKTASVVASLQEQLLIIKIQFIDHCNITQNHLEVKQLHFKEKAVGRLALNFY